MLCLMFHFFKTYLPFWNSIRSLVESAKIFKISSVIHHPHLFVSSTNSSSLTLAEPSSISRSDNLTPWIISLSIPPNTEPHRHSGKQPHVLRSDLLRLKLSLWFQHFPLESPFKILLFASWIAKVFRLDFISFKNAIIDFADFRFCAHWNFIQPVFSVHNHPRFTPSLFNTRANGSTKFLNKLPLTGF